MTLSLSLTQIRDLHGRLVDRFGGARGERDRGALEAALARPPMTFGGEDLYADVPAKAAALMHSLVVNHPFVDGNKRVGALALELFLFANEHDLAASDGDLEIVTMALARGEIEAAELAIWVRLHSRRQAVWAPARSERCPCRPAPGNGRGARRASVVRSLMAWRNASRPSRSGTPGSQVARAGRPECRAWRLRRS